MYYNSIYMYNVSSDWVSLDVPKNWFFIDILVFVLLRFQTPKCRLPDYYCMWQPYFIAKLSIHSQWKAQDGRILTPSTIKKLATCFMYFESSLESLRYIIFALITYGKRVNTSVRGIKSLYLNTCQLLNSILSPCPHLFGKLECEIRKSQNLDHDWFRICGRAFLSIGAFGAMT